MTTSYWLTAVNGNWDTSSDWNSDSVPGEDDAVFINASGAPYSVDSKQSNEAGSLTLVSPATLIVDTNTHFTVFGNISNAGTIELSNQGTNNTYLIINTYTVTLTGGGFLMMTDSAGNNIQGNTGGGQFGNSLINANNTIEGAGTIGGDGLAIDNQAVIDATGSNNALIIDTQFNGNPNSSQPGTIDNTGTLEATGSGGLQIQDTAVNNVGGLIYADGGNVDLQDAFITGGTLETSNGGSIDVVDGSSTLDGTGGNIVDNTGTVDVEYQQRLVLQGTIDNSGSIVLQGENDNTYGWTGLQIYTNGATLTGGGTVIMSADPSSEINGYDGTGDDPFTNVNNTIEGGGSFVGGLALVNEGLIDANAADPLTINLGGTVTNTGTMEATGPGELLIQQTSIDNVGGLIYADGGNVDLQSAFITGGILKSADGGSVAAIDNHSTLDGTANNTVDIIGTLNVNYEARLKLQGTIDNTGTIKLNGQNDNTYSWTGLIIGTNGATLTGGGVVIMADDPSSEIQGNDGSGADPFTNVDNTIEGDGTFDGGLALDNQGVIDATGVSGIFIDNIAPVTNTGTLEASNPNALAQTGGMLIQGTTVDNAGGIIEANDSQVQLQAAVIAGGALKTANGGAIEILQSQSQTTFDGTDSTVANSGDVEMLNGSVLQLQGAIDNSGTITLASTGNGTILRATTENATVEGGGEIVLGDNSANQINGVNYSTLTNVDNTISGAGGFYGLTLVNEASGVIDATYSDTALVINTGQTVVNDGTLEADGGTLTVDDNVTGSGSVKIGSDGTAQFTASFGQNVSFDGSGQLQIKNGYSGTISNMAVGDSVDVTNQSLPNGATLSFQENDTDTGGTLAVFAAGGNSALISLKLAGDYGTVTSSDFTLTSQGGGTVITDVSATPSAIPSLPSTRLELGSFHVGATATMPISVANTSTNSDEALDVAVGGTTGDAYASGSISLLGAGQTDSTDIIGGLNSADDGAQTGIVLLDFVADGTGPGADGTQPKEIGSQYVTLDADFFKEAAASITAPTLIVHAGDSGTENLTVTNTDAADGFSERLDAAITGFTGALTSANGATEVAAGASDNTAFSVGYTATQAGAISGDVAVQLASDGSGIDNFGTTQLGSVQVPVTITVNNYAQEALSASVGQLQGSGTSYTLNLGEVEQGGSLSAIITMANGAVGPADLLSGNLTLETGSGFNNSGSGTFSDLGTGQSATPETVSLPTSTLGTFSETFLIQGTGSNASGYSGTLPDETLTVTGTVVPAPDLVVTGITAPAQALSGQGVLVSWTIENDGAATATGPWQDDVYLTSDAQGDNPQLLGTFAYDGSLAPGQSVTRSEIVQLPALASGDLYFAVKADATNTVDPVPGTPNHETIANSPIAVTQQALPNLEVTGITPPVNALSGQQAQVSWTVTNEGDGGTSANSWVDDVYLSQSGTINSSTPSDLGGDLLLASVPNTSYLAPGQSYTSTATVTLPIGISGPYYLIVETDANDQVFEAPRSADNISASSVIGVTLTPPPDLQVSNLIVPAQSFSGQTVFVSWRVTNTGTGSTVEDAWTDAVYESFDGSFDSSSKLLGTVVHNGALAAGQSYSTGTDITLPTGVSGNATIFVVTDYQNEVYEGALHANDTGSAVTDVNLTPPPLLVASIVSAPTTGVAYHDLDFTYQVTNDGATTTPNSAWTDDVYLSATPTLTDSATLLSSTTHHGALAVDQSYDVSASVALPNVASGNYYVIVQTNVGDSVFEANYSNDTVVSNAITIANSPPELEVSSVSAPSQGEAGQQAQISWQVTNDGVGDTGLATWSDEVVLSASGVLGASDNIVLGTFAAPNGASDPLAVGAHYTQYEDITLPETLTGTYTLFVIADSSQSVPGADSEASAGQILSVGQQLADLRVSSVSGSASATAGGTVTVQWTVDNDGEGTTDAAYWNDDVYLSTTPTLTGSSVLLGQVQHNNAIAPGGSYSAGGTFALPSDLTAGSYYFIVATDAVDQVTETSHSDNTTASASTAQIAAAMPVVAPELAVTNLDIASQTTSGQSLTVSYTVTDLGGATPQGGWYDAIYLSPNQVLGSNSDIYLGSVKEGALAAGASTDVSQSFTIPNGLSGQYSVFVVADPSDSLNQSSQADNTASSPVEVNLPAVADFTVASVEPEFDSADGAITVSYTVDNQSSNQETGSWTDAIYLSSTPTWSANDTLLGTVEHFGGVAGNGSYSGGLNASIPGILPGSYYVIVRTDIKSESIGTNATAVSANPIAVTLPTLTPETPATGNLTTSYTPDSQYYEVTVGAGQTLDLSLTSNPAWPPGGFGPPYLYTNQAINNIYVQYGALPTANTFELSTVSQNSADPSLVIPDTQAGTYYVMVAGDSTWNIGNTLATVSGQPVDLETITQTENYSLNLTVLPFSITSVTPSYGSNLGTVALTIDGSQLSANDQIELVAANGTVTDAQQVQFVNDTQLWANFNLQGLPTGDYSVEAVDGSQTATLSDAFTVNHSQVGQLSIDLIAPSILRPGQSGTVTVEYANTGDTNIAAPIIDLSTAQALFNNGDGSSTGTGQVSFLATNPDGPAGVLQPGAEGSESFSYTPLSSVGRDDYVDFTAGTLSPTAPIDWSGLEQSLRTPNVDAIDWSNVWNNFTAEVGITYASVDNALSQAATELSQIGQPTDDISTLEQLELRQASGLLVGTQLVGTTDIAPNSSPLSLSLDRIYSASVINRNDAGLFGDGWTSTYDGSAITDASGNVYINALGGGFFFTLQSNGSYAAASGEDATLSVVNGLYQMQVDGSVVQFNAAGQLSSYADSNGNVTSLSYNGAGNLQQVTEQTTGETITFTSNAEGHITSATDSNGTQITYTYDPTGNLLLGAIGPSGTTNYSYEAATGSVNDNALTSVTNTDGTQSYFTYNAQGLLASSAGANGVGLETYNYTSPGEVTVTDALGNQTNLLFDANGNIAEVQDPLGGVTQAQYNSLGEVTGIVTPDNTVASYSYDTLGDLTGSTDPLGGTSSLAYTSGPPNDPNLTGYTNQLGSQTQYTYNVAGEVTGISYQNGSGDIYQYNTAGLLVSSTDANGNATTYSYNGDGELTKESFSDGTSDTFTYDSRGNLLTATADGATDTYTYNSANQLSSFTNQAGQIISYTYNANGQLAAETDPNGAVTQYSYDAAGQLTELQDGSGNLLDKYTYNAAGQLIEAQTGNGASTTYTYDADARTTEITNYNADGGIASFYDYTYTANSQIATESTSDGNWNFSYDAAGELTDAVFQSTDASVQNQAISYAYDAAGNRISQTVNGDTISYTLNSMNQVVASSDGTTYAYDADGNLISEKSSAGTTTFAYNANDQLVSQNGPTGTFQYSYDALGNLVSETTNGATTNYVNDPLLDSAVQTYNASGGLIATYDYGLGLTAEANSAGGVSYVDTDASGNVTGLSGPTGTQSASYFYLPFGQATQLSGTANNPLQFAGASGVTSDGSGLDLMGARYYDPSLGRFISPDPLGLAGSTDLYTYANNDPLDQVDPSGLEPTTLGGTATGTVTSPSVGIPGVGGFNVSGGVTTDGDSIGIVFGVNAKIGGGLSPSVSGSYTPGSTVKTGATIKATGQYNNRTVTTDLISGSASAGRTTSNGLGAKLTLQQTIKLPVKVISNKDAMQYLQDQNEANKVNGTQIQSKNDPDDPFKKAAQTYGDDQVTADSQERAPGDPNDLIGPAAFGPQNFVSASRPLAYTIDFENESTATAPAQTVTITEQLDPNLNWYSFRLTSFGFDNQNYTVGNEAFYSETLDLSATKGYDVDVTAGVNVVTGVVTWTFQTIDPATGQTPLDPTVGFLPVDDASNDGDGYVSYTIDAKPGAPTGTVVNAQATVLFDNNPPISTPVVSDTLDADAPTSKVTALPAQTANTSFEVSWSGTDDPAGPGIASYTIYVSEDGGAATVWLSDSTLTNAIFNGQAGHTYSFSSTATDNAGDTEAQHATPDTTIAVGQIVASPIVSTPPTVYLHLGESGSIDLTVSNAAPAGAYSESLIVNAGTGTGTTLTIPSGEIVAGSSATVGVAITSESGVGTYTDSANFSFLSDGTPINDGFGQTSLGTDSVPITVVVENAAVATVTKLSGAGTLTQTDATDYTLNLGTVALGSSAPTADIAILNAASGPSDALAGSFSIAGDSAFINDNFTAFSGVNAGQTDSDPTVALNTTSAGTFAETITFTPTATNGSGSSPLATETITVTGTVQGPSPPVVVAESTSVVAGATATGTGGAAGTGALAGDSDPNSATLSVSAVGGSAGDVGTSVAGTYGHLTLNTDGSYSYVADIAAAIGGAAAGSHPVDTFNYTVSDTDGASTEATLAFTIDRPPALSSVATAAGYGSGPIKLSPNLVAANPDGDNLTGATVAMSGGFADDGDMLTATTTNTNITAVYDSADETLTLSGSDTAAHYTSVLDSVTFKSAYFDANNAGADDTRTVTWTVADGSNDGSLSNNSPPATIIQIGSPAVDDYTGAGTSDILFRDNSTGDTGFYAMSNGALTGWRDVGGSSTAYSIVGVGDFTGSGTDGILYRDNSTGDTGFYELSNGVLQGWHDVGASSTAYSVVGVGDFTGNGTDDILYRDNSTGDTGFYELSDGILQGWRDVGSSSTAYSVVGVGDFTGNGTDDILYRDNSTGDTGFYELSNGVLQGWHDVGASSTAYSVVGVGDFMGNGIDDILYRDNSTGDTGFYNIVNGVNTGWYDVGASSTAYSVVATGDYLGTGTSDILFRNNTTGDTGFYQIVNGANAGWHDIGASSAAYHVAS